MLFLQCPHQGNISIISGTSYIRIAWHQATYHYWSNDKFQKNTLNGSQLITRRIYRRETHYAYSENLAFLAQ
jgi:hypothetical protein